MIETSIYTVLSTDVTVSALVSTRIYPMIIPQNGTLPAVVYQRVSTLPINSLSGDSGLDSVRIQLSCWSPTYAGAKSLGLAVRNALTLSSLKAITEMELDDIDDLTGHYRVILDFRIWQ